MYNILNLYGIVQTSFNVHLESMGAISFDAFVCKPVISMPTVWTLTGIPDFRSPGGLWSKFDPSIYCDFQTFQAKYVANFQVLFTPRLVSFQILTYLGIGMSFTVNLSTLSYFANCLSNRTLILKCK